ncbi:hypothetical protein ACFLYM_01290 [Chloroflexota bacterium]
MTSLLERPITIKVTTNVQGIPLNINISDKIERITKIYQHWIMPDQPSSEREEKRYYRVGTNKSQVYDIYRNTADGIWYLDRIHQ